MTKGGVTILGYTDLAGRLPRRRLNSTVRTLSTS